ncbi:MAG: hypothetical protein ACLT8E_07975 [Akkermansia sp.]
MIEAGAPVNAQSIFMHDGTKEPGDTLTWACSSGLYMNSGGRQVAAGAVSCSRRGRPDQPGPWGVTPFMYSAALMTLIRDRKNSPGPADAGSPDLGKRPGAESASSAFPLPFTNGSSRQVMTSTNASLKASSPPHLVCTKENRRNHPPH